MKHSFRLLLLILTLIGRALIPLPLRAQPNDPAPHESTVLFENADEVVVYTKDSIPVALQNLAQILQAKGFVVDTVIQSLVHTQITQIPSIYESKEAATANATAYLRTRGKETLIILEGYTIRQSKLVPNRKVKMEHTRYQGPRRGYLKAAFRQLEAVALAYPNGRVLYRAGMWEDRLK